MEDVVEQIWDDLLEARRNDKWWTTSKRWANRGEICGSRAKKITCRVNTKQEEKGENHIAPFGQPLCPVPRQRSEPVLENYTPAIWSIFKKTMRPFATTAFCNTDTTYFRHLLLCRRSNGRYITCVPGSYDQQEQFMAGIIRLFLLQRKQLYQGEKRQGRVLVPCDWSTCRLLKFDIPVHELPIIKLLPLRRPKWKWQRSGKKMPRFTIK